MIYRQGVGMYKKLIFGGLCLFFSLVALPVAATTVSVQIVQMDDSYGDVSGSSLIIEETIMDFMFSQGYIVSNSPIIYNKDKAKNGMKVSLEDAINGSADYLAYITIYFDRSNSSMPEGNILSNIELAQWKLIRVKGKQQLDSGTEAPGSLVQIDNSETGISTFGHNVAKAINTALRKKN